MIPCAISLSADWSWGSINVVDVLIVGGGPAGVSAALYTARAGIDTTIICMGIGALEKAERVDNFYGNGGITGQALVEVGLSQASDVGVEIITGEVVKIEQQNIDGEWLFSVETADASVTARALLLATGNSRAMPKIPGLIDYEGKGVSHCAVCDAFFYRGQDVAVLGSGKYALSEAKELIPLVNSLTLLTNGNELEALLPAGITVRKEKIREAIGEARLTGIVLEPDGEILPVSGLFLALGIAGATDLAYKLGAFTENNAIIVDKNMRTSVPGLWAAGDCTGGMKQIAKAVYQGAEAGTDMVRFLRGDN